MAENGKKILVVDDEPLVAETLIMAFEKAGFRCLAASDGSEAISATEEWRPDLILLDIMLPKINGYKVCRRLKSDERFKEIPIIIVSARTQEKDVVLGLESGADEYVTKPFEMKELVELVRRYLETT